MENQKRALIEELKSDGLLKNKKILKSFEKVPRESFVQKEYKKFAYLNQPLPIPEGQFISQPFTVIAMTGALDIQEGHKILEVGSGSGYQAAILSELVGENGKVFTIEVLETLKNLAEKNLSRYKNVKVILGDGSKGYSKEAPYDRIIVAASAQEMPRNLIKQLKDKGKMVIPVGSEMYVMEKRGQKLETKMIGYYSFVPLVEKGK